MAVQRVLIANRGEIAVRIMRTAADHGIETVAVFPADDATSMHARSADIAVQLRGEGPSAYLDIDQLVEVAGREGCDAVHPGYGFLAENPDFAAAVAAVGLTFVGPRPDTLGLFGDKAQARAHAIQLDVPVLAGTGICTNIDDARSFIDLIGPDAAIMIKAVAGGGGRGMRALSLPVGDTELAAALERCASEAVTAFGDGSLYLEQQLRGARHVEVQIVGDGSGAVALLGDRECSVQRQRQKLLEIAPAIALSATARAQIQADARTLAESVDYRGLGTIEFLVRGDEAVFIEANARIQVEHTVTEEIYGVDLVACQLALAGGASLADLALPVTSRGFAVQARVNLERIEADGSVKPAGGTITAFAPPTGIGIRVDTYAQPGYTTNPRYDSLLAKVIAWSPDDDPRVALTRTARALVQFVIDGAPSTAPLVAAIAAHPDVASGVVTTTWLDDHLPELLATVDAAVGVASPAGGGSPGAAIVSDDPLAVLHHGDDAAMDRSGAGGPDLIEGQALVSAPMQGTILSIDVSVGDQVAAGQPVAVMEAMKMEHVIAAEVAGTVRRVGVVAGEAVFEGHTLVVVEASAEATVFETEANAVDLDAVRPDLQESLDRHGVGLDENRPKAVEKRRRTGQRTARENLDDLLDADSYIEYGPLAIAPQRRRRTVEDLIENTPADGMIAGIGRVNGEQFDEHDARCVVMSYDYTVLAGTQGGVNHRKKDRLFELAQQWKLPVIFFTEGGGGRPGDTDGMGVAGLDCLAFGLWGELSGLVPLIGINSGYCFAGNAAILGCCDVIIATENSNIGMGGPAMIEGGGLGVYKPTEIGPMDVQRANGVVDIAVSDEAEAVAVAKQYLSYFQGAIDDWSCADQRELRHAIPENRLRVYDIRRVIETMFDDESVLELRRDFGHGMVTALARVEGRPVGVIANNPAHLAGAIDSDAADKAARFMQLCDAFDLPIVSLCDTPGFMVGPEHERTGLVRHVSRMFVTARSVTVPTCTIVLRKGYGLGAQAMASGGFKFPMFTVAWPTGEFGGMGLEGAVKLGYRKELEAIEDPDERVELYNQLVDRMYRVGKGVSMADHFEIDDVIDPIDSRHWISTAFSSAPPPPPREGKKRPMIDTW